MWLISYVTCIDIAQVYWTRWSVFLFLDVAILKLKIIINVLPTNQPEIIIQPEKIKLPSPNRISEAFIGPKSIFLNVSLILFIRFFLKLYQIKGIKKWEKVTVWGTILRWLF